MQSALVHNDVVYIGGQYKDIFERNVTGSGQQLIPLKSGTIDDPHNIISITIPTTREDDTKGETRGERWLIVTTSNGSLHLYDFDYDNYTIDIKEYNKTSRQYNFLDMMYADIMGDKILCLTSRGHLFYTKIGDEKRLQNIILTHGKMCSKFSTYNGDIVAINSDHDLMAYISSYKDEIIKSSDESIVLDKLTRGIKFVDVNIKYGSLIAIDNEGYIYLSGHGTSDYYREYKNNKNRLLTNLIKVRTGDVKFRSVSKGAEITAFIDTKNNLWTCCTPSLMGISSVSDEPPLSFVMENVDCVSCGYNFIFVKLLNGDIYVFGDNLHDQLGLSENKTVQVTPRLLYKSNIRDNVILFNQIPQLAANKR